jgi:type IV pilus assembly protein PilY1
MNTKSYFFLAVTILVASSKFALAGTISISQDPLFTAGADRVKPNIMFLLDDSGSMNDENMPDYVKDETHCKSIACAFADPPYNSNEFNGIYYNPTVTYQPGVTNDGVTSMASQFRMVGPTKRWDQVQTDPYLSPSSKVSVELINDKIYCKVSSPTAGQKSTADSTGVDCRKNGMKYGSTAVGYSYPDGTYKNTIPISSPPYYYNMTVEWCKASLAQCQSTKDATYAYAKYSNVTRVDIAPTAACTPTCKSGRSYEDEMTNYANWYAYYRTRLLMAKTSSGLGFSILSDNARVGFMTIHTTSSSSSEYLKINDFVPSGHRKIWYNKLYGATTDSGTPLKPALSLTGRMYAGTALDDPIQQSCQKNWAIMTTDGFWNSGTGVKIDGTSPVGNQDNTNSGISIRPKYDGGNASATDTLADVAMYYYKTDLRPTMLNDVSGNSRDPASHQHMTTYTIGLGVSGQLAYRPDYETATAGDFALLKSGSKDWPVPVSGGLTTIDDLWHAAVNGGGVYYSARSSQDLVLGLMDALRSINLDVGAAAAAATSNPNVVAGDNFIFSSTYQTKIWDGELTRQQIDPANGSISSTIDWSARTKLNEKVLVSSDTRAIYMWAGSGPTNVKSFEWGNLSVAQKAWFSPTLTSQYASLSVVGKPLADTAGSMIGYLRGQTGLEDDAGNADFPYRGRDYALGDIVSGEAVYVKKPRFKYSDADYAAFASAKASRQAMVYTPANDGMLHAINADTGAEVWSYIPSMVMPKMYKLADKLYEHQFFVDGTPVVGDVYDGSKWRTILVGGLNAGGIGYYALDVTDPTSPIALWQFCNDAALCNKVDANIGYSFGNPVITKVKGQWTVLLTSGYNNADGKGYLYMLDPITGAHRTGSSVLVASGCTGGHCGLAKISGWVDDSANNSTTDVYGGDLDGNLWRIQVGKRQSESVDPSTPIVTLLAELRGSTVARQPVTTKPELGEFKDKRIVMVGTGKFLGKTDNTDKSLQTFYGVKDALVATGWGPVRDGGILVEQKLTESTRDGARVRSSTNNIVDWDSKAGWYVDLPDAGERVTGDPSLSLGTISFTSNVPTTTATCSDTDGGYSFLYNLDFRTGGFVTGANIAANGQPVASQFLTNALATRPVVVKLPDGKLVAIITLSNGQKLTGEVPYPKGFKGRRSSWREIIIK